MMKVGASLSRTLGLACALAAFAACSRPDAAGKAVASGPDRLFVSNERGDSISVIDAASGGLIRALAVGRRPRGITLSPDGTRLYVALSGSAIEGPGMDKAGAAPDRSQDGIGVVNLADLSIGRMIKAGADPEAMAISPDGQTLFTSNEDTGETSILDLKSGQVRARIKVGAEPEGAAVSPDGKILLVACEAANAVYVIDIATAKVTGVIQVDGRPRALAFSANGMSAYASNEDSGEVSLLDIPARKVRTVIAIPAAGAGGATPLPMGLVFGADRTKLYVTTGRGKGVAEIDTASNTVARMFSEVGERPWGIALSRDGAFLYTANGPSNDISQIEIATGRVVRRIPAGASPWGVVYEARR